MESHPSQNLSLVGITGTNGKTSVTYFLEQIWHHHGISGGVIGTVSTRYADKIIPSRMTTPEAEGIREKLCDMLDHGVTHVAMEVSSHGLELKRADQCHFDVAVFTNLSHDHLDFHKSFAAYYAAKRKLFTELLDASCKYRKCSVVNVDDPYGEELLKEARGEIVTYAIQNRADLKVENLSLTKDGSTFDLVTENESATVQSPFIGRYNVYNVLAASGAALYLGVPLAVIADAISSMGVIPGRLEKIGNDRGINVLVDYANTPDALTNVLKTLREFYGEQIILVVGCGGERDNEKRPVMGEIGATLCAALVITTDNPRSEDPETIIKQIYEGAQGYNAEVIVIPDRKTAIAAAIELAQPGETVLIAGRGHEPFQLVGDERIPLDDRQVARFLLTSE